jgi:hypothetical protein
LTVRLSSLSGNGPTPRPPNPPSRIFAHGSVWAALGLIIAALAGVAIATGHGVLLGVGLAFSLLLWVLPLEVLMDLVLVASLGFRVIDPTGGHLTSYVPDLLLLLFVARVGMNLALVEGRGTPKATRRMATLVVCLLVLAAGSALANGNASIALVSSVRQFLRFPVWALAAFLSGVTWVEGKRILWVVLAFSLIQLPLAAYQFFLGTGIDRVTGTFGEGGSGVMMIFLVSAAVVWFSLSVAGSLRWRTLLVVLPALLLPMAWGSAVAFLLLLPLALLGLVLRSASSGRSRISFAHVVGGTLLVVAGVWAAQSFSLAPGFASSAEISGVGILSQGYIGRYFATTEAEPGSRLGFLRFAVRTNLDGGPKGVLFGQGPSSSIIGAPSLASSNQSLSLFAAAAAHSVWSLQRFLLGYGFVALAIYMALILSMSVMSQKHVEPPDRTAQALLLATPILGAIALFAGPYTAGWSDPGVAAGFWALVVAAHTALGSSEPAPPGLVSNDSPVTRPQLSSRGAG